MGESTAFAPGARVPQIGGLLALRAVVSFLRSPMAAMAYAHARYGPLVVVHDPLPPWPGRQRTVFASGAALLREVLGDRDTWRAAGLGPVGPRGSAQRRLRFNLMQQVGAPHARTRRILGPALRRERIDEMAGALLGRMVATAAAWPRGRTLELWALVNDLLAPAAGALLFGGEMEEHRPLIAAIDRHLNDCYALPVAGLPVRLPGLPYHGFLRRSEMLERLLIAWAKGRAHRPDDGGLLSALLRGAPDAPDGVGPLGHVLMVAGAALFTCRSALSWTLLLLAQHPQVGHELLDEIGDGTDPARVAGAALLDRVVRESLRLLPPAPYIMRVATADTTVGGIRVPRRSRAMLSLLVTQRNPDLFREPDRFLPERWHGLDPTPYEYPAFGGGTHSCPGFWFGNAVLRNALAAILPRHRMELREGLRVDSTGVLATQPRAAVPLVLHRQDRAAVPLRLRGEIADLVRVA